MKKRVLGKTGLEVSIIGLGGIPLQRVDQEKAKQIIDKCIKEGINFIDTARVYTISEELIGNAITDKRDGLILATKSIAKDYDGMKRDIEISLENLQTEYIDIYQLHLVKTIEMYNKIMGEDGAYKAMLEAQSAGKIGHIGITAHGVDVLKEIIEKDADRFATIQFPYNPIENQAEELFKKAKELNLGIIVMKPIAGGAIHEGELSLRYILNNTNVTTAIPGMDNVDQVAKNTKVGKEILPLTTEEKNKLKQIADELGTEFCRRCGYCGPCPEGIDIPTQFILESYYLRYELQGWAKERYESMPIKAEHCVKCGACEPKCPYNLPIRDMMERVSKNLG